MVTLTLRLTHSQRAVMSRLRERVGVAGDDALAAAATAHDRARPPDPRWLGVRPPGRAPSASPPDCRLDAVLPAASGVALALTAGQRLRVEQLEDGQGVDLGAVTADGRGLSAARTREAHGIAPTTGTTLWSTPPEIVLLTIESDTAPGHDLLFPPCSARAYEAFAGVAGHRGCAELHADALAAAGCAGPAVDDVLNLWLPSAVAEDGRLRSWPAACRAGDHVELVAHTDLVISLSTCPDDLYGTSQYAPKPIRVLVSGGSPGHDVRRSPWPGAPPRSAVHEAAAVVHLDGADLAHVVGVTAGGWLGDTHADVVRALILRLHESVAQIAA